MMEDKVLQEIKKLSHNIQMTHREREEMRTRLSAFVRAYPHRSKNTKKKQKSPYFPLAQLLFKRTVTIALITFLSFHISKPVSARSLPGELLYPIKIIHEEIEEVGIKDPKEKVQFQIKRTKRRIEEAKILKKKHKLDKKVEKKIAEKIKEHVESATETITQIKNETPDEALRASRELVETLEESTKELESLDGKEIEEGEDNAVTVGEEDKEKNEETESMNLDSDQLEEGTEENLADENTENIQKEGEGEGNSLGDDREEGKSEIGENTDPKKLAEEESSADEEQMNEAKNEKDLNDMSPILEESKDEHVLSGNAIEESDIPSKNKNNLLGGEEREGEEKIKEIDESSKQGEGKKIGNAEEENSLVGVLKQELELSAKIKEKIETEVKQPNIEDQHNDDEEMNEAEKDGEKENPQEEKREISQVVKEEEQKEEMRSEESKNTMEEKEKVKDREKEEKETGKEEKKRMNQYCLIPINEKDEMLVPCEKTRVEDELLKLKEGTGIREKSKQKLGESSPSSNEKKTTD